MMALASNPETNQWVAINKAQRVIFAAANSGLGRVDFLRCIGLTSCGLIPDEQP